ncbi:MAG: type II toxin-antitoxin system Phd/YefM family antitoxin [Elusimicrobia bacterium]|nr:type II toxin-antitoxin system Phd/YefM family antitoxin [Elusimicrobiota bacterium]
MKTVTFTELRHRAKKYFDAVERGEMLEVFRHGKPVALLMPVGERGLARWRRAQPLKLSGASLSQAIRTERAETRS